MAKSLAFVAALLLAAAPAGAQEARSCSQGQTCSCDTLVDRNGVLNPAHCDAWRVKEVLGRYAEGSARLLPEHVTEADIELSRRKLEQIRREAVRELLMWMSRDELQRFAPVLLGDPGPSDMPPGSWPGGPLADCDKALYWINQAISEMTDVDSILTQLDLELANFPYPDPTSPTPNPYIMCDPSVVLGSPTYITARGLHSEARQWLQLAAAAMSNGMPVLAALDSFIASWRSAGAYFGLFIAYSQAPINNDARCTEIADAGLALAPVAQAAHQGYEWAKKCVGTGGFFF